MRTEKIEENRGAPTPFGSTESTPETSPLHTDDLSEGTLRFLLSSSLRFASSLDHSETLEHITRLPLPLLADACILYLFREDGTVAPHCASQDPSIEATLSEFAACRASQIEDSDMSTLSPSAEGGNASADLSPFSPTSDGSCSEDTEALAAGDRMVLPLRNEERMLGLLCFYRFDPGHPFSEADRAAAEVYAGQAALALKNSGRFGKAQAAYSREHTTAETFRKSFLPHLPAQVPGIEIAQCYVPAQSQTKVGGDFYDMYQLGPNHYSIVLGDVSGKGIEAAILTAMAKYNLRGLVTEFLYPQTVLSKLSVLLSDQLPPERFVSLFYGVFNLRGHQLLYANAGHEAAVVEHGDGRTEFLEATGPILGLIPDNEYREHTVILELGSSLLLYTDGLTEVRRGKEMLGQEGVADLFRATRGHPPQQRLRMLLDGAREYGMGVFRDDVAALLLHLTPSDETPKEVPYWASP